MSDFDLCRMSALELGRLIQSRKVSPMEVAEVFLGAVRVFNPPLNAVVTIDEELTMAEARRAHKLINAGERPDSPLAGVPFLAKDLDVTAGMRTTFGSRLSENYVPNWDMFHIARLKAAGGVLLGKTNTPEDGLIPATFNPVFGPSLNPWNPKLGVGGSSGGSGAAVAAGLAPVATGSDGVGSIRVPASINGCFGIKPTFGTVPFGPKGIGILNTIGHLGPLTRSALDAAAALDVMAGPAEHDRWSMPRAPESYLAAAEQEFDPDKPIAWSLDLGYARVEPEVEALFRAAIEKLAAAGWPLEEAHPGFADPLRAADVFVAVEWGTVPMRLGEKDAAAYELQDEPVKSLAEKRRAMTLEDLWDANQTRKNLCVAMGRFWDRYELLLTPTLTRTAFDPDRAWPQDRERPGEEDHGFTNMVYPFNLTGDPACSLPMGLTPERMPAGLQMVGPRFADGLVLRAARVAEEVIGPLPPPPHGADG